MYWCTRRVVLFSNRFTKKGGNDSIRRATFRKQDFRDRIDTLGTQNTMRTENKSTYDFPKRKIQKMEAELICCYTWRKKKHLVMNRGV